MAESIQLDFHHLLRLLFDLGISSPEDLELYYPKTRDRNDVSVYRCRRSEVLVLSDIRHMSLEHYREKDEFVFGEKHNRLSATRAALEDSESRAAEIRPLILNKRWLDVGAGHGGILDMLAPMAECVTAVEPQNIALDGLREAGYSGYANIQEIKGTYDTITLFHVFEHLPEPLEMLKTLRRLLAPGGVIYLEVPHARDFLLTHLDCAQFRAFTLWSEHLILHTRQSLAAFVKAGGFNEFQIIGKQRYPLANHLYWLAKGKPGGHRQWSHLRSQALDSAYEQTLSRIDRTDTLTVIITAP